MGRVIAVDAGSLFHSAIFAWGRDFLLKATGKINYVMPSYLNYYQMLISCLKKINVQLDDIVIIAEEGKSWRKIYSAEYKGNRAALKEKYPHINFPEHYKKINELHEKLNKATAFHFLRVPTAEADDIIAVATKKYSDREVIVISLDGDLKQLCARPNVKFFSFGKKYKGTRGCYLEIENGYKILDEKIRKGDRSDNILVEDPNDANETAIRELIVNLLELPEDIENEIMQELDKIQPKDYYLDDIPHKNTKIGKRFSQIFDESYKVTYEECINYKPRKKAGV